MKTITQGTRSISIGDHQNAYIPEVQRHFDAWFAAINEDTDHLDFSAPRLSQLHGWQFPIWLPSFTESITDLDQYIAHAQLQPGDIAIDGGGFAGLTAMLLALQVGPAGHVITFEPDIANAFCLRRNLNEFTKRYGYGPELIEAALWDSTGQIQFSADTAMGSSAVQIVGPRGNVTTVRTLTLTDAAAHLPRVDYVKLDIEGAETNALSDSAFFTTHRPRLSIECHHTLDAVLTQLDALDYDSETLTQNTSTFPLVQAWPR
jgi:FkbM family methyltransferase